MTTTKITLTIGEETHEWEADSPSELARVVREVAELLRGAVRNKVAEARKQRSGQSLQQSR